jgi:catechol 2,3-dioxygenase-like lactoylglutathione lyase family enzyme
MAATVYSVGIYCRDQDAAKRFWTDTMGFELVRDEPMGPEGGPRWIEVRPPAQDVKLVLYTPDGQEDRIGTFSNVLFEVDDVNALYEELTGKGVVFAGPPEKAPWGRWWAQFQDPDGNSYGLGADIVD